MMEFSNKDITPAVISMFHTLKEAKENMNIMKREIKEI